MPKGKKKKNSPSPAEQNPDNYWEIKQKLDKKGKRLFDQQIYEDWCKKCGICIALCPAKVFEQCEDGSPAVKDPDACIGCRFCEYHCPDFAITIRERYPDRRKKKNDT